MKYKKIAIVSDIHAQMDALDTLIEYLDREQIQLVLNLGDFISNGPNPCEVFDKIMSDKRFINIKGYDEESIFDDIKAKAGIGQGEWLISKLGIERVNKLKGLPSMRSMKINGKQFLLCHNNGWSDIVQLEAHTRKLDKKSFDYIVYGGSHMQELAHTKDPFFNTNIIDPGTLGTGGEKGYLVVIEFVDKEANIQFQSLRVKTQEKKEDKTRYSEKIEIERQQEEAVALQDMFLYIQGHQSSNNSRMYIEKEVVDCIIKIGIRQCKYVSIGCWKHEKQIIRELLYYLKCRTIKTSENDDQEWYIGEITPEVINLLQNKRCLPEGRLKWLEISFQNTLESTSPIYSIYHYGKESFLKRLTIKELYHIEELLKKYDLPYTIPKNE